MTTSINIPKRKQLAPDSTPSSLSSSSSSSQTPASPPTSPFQDESRREGKKAERRVSLLKIFLPSHSDHLSLSPDLERKKDPVHEIVLTDDEIRGIFPQ
ncbi:hypothetical protein MMC34_005353 [Xylographa carneopallida]|nr:hypothetical protein [Xylographa carneopallida]